MKYSELEIAGMLQDNQDTIYELKEEVKRYKQFCTYTCYEDENLRNRVIDRVKKELGIKDNKLTWG